MGEQRDDYFLTDFKVLADATGTQRGAYEPHPPGHLISFV